ncbi:MAG TPA: 50S ribosomal protein L18e [Nitrososphaerales archaeon]|nr:50S ribosomal protein L18e [Nitrososphaerales archaeon]
MKASNPELKHAVVMLERAGRKQNLPIWAEASELLARPASTKVEVNVGRISRIASSGAKVFVPGKVLGSGMVEKKLVVGAFSFSASARAKIEAKGGSAISIEQFVKKYPDGSGVKIVQ